LSIGIGCGHTPEKFLLSGSQKAPQEIMRKPQQKAIKNWIYYQIPPELRRGGRLHQRREWCNGIMCEPLAIVLLYCLTPIELY
jgi:hypothetical protein